MREPDDYILEAITNLTQSRDKLFTALTSARENKIIDRQFENLIQELSIITGVIIEIECDLRSLLDAKDKYGLTHK